MLTYIIDKVLGTKSERELKPLQPIVDKINSYDAQYSALSDDALKNKTVEFKERLAKGETTLQISTRNPRQRDSHFALLYCKP